MKLNLEQDDDKARENAIVATGKTVGRFALRSVTAADISFFERAGISDNVTVIENGKSRSVNMGDFYSVYASTYILTSDPKSNSRQLHDFQKFTDNVDDWVIDKNITRAEFIALAETIAELNREWRTSTSESNGSASPGN
jgi:hypothetical protein